MTLEDIPERLRKPGLIINNGQKGEITLSEQQGDDLAFMAKFADKKQESA